MEPTFGGLEANINCPVSVPPQGLTHLGKGTLTLCPYHSDRQLMSQVAVAGLLTVLVSFLDVKNSEPTFPILTHSPISVFFFLFKATFPKWFLCSWCSLCILQ